jgi:hypothetical protein
MNETGLDQVLIVGFVFVTITPLIVIIFIIYYIHCINSNIMNEYIHYTGGIHSDNSD